MVQRLLSRFKGLKIEAGRLGWGWTLLYRILKRLGVKEIALRAKGVRTPVYCRIADSDIYDFNQSLGKWEVPLRLAFTPKTIVDAGANVGYATLRFLKYFPEAKIIAIEPESMNVTQFKKNCSSYRNVSLEEKALWPTATTLGIDSPSGASNAFVVYEDPHGSIETVSIPGLMQKYGLEEIDLLKIDIEGSERQLFSHPNIQDWLAKVKVMLIETHDVTLNLAGCSDTVRAAASQHFVFLGHLNEYEYFINRSYKGQMQEAAN